MNRTTNSTSQHRPWTPLHPRQHLKRVRTTTGLTSRPSWTPSDPGITGDATTPIGSDASLMPWHQPLCHNSSMLQQDHSRRRNRISGGALGNRGAPLSGVTEVRTSILFATVSPCALRGTCPPHPNAAVRCEPFRFVQGLRPLRRKAAIPGARRGPDVSQIWETSERRRCNDSAPRQARKTRSAAQHSDNENIHGENKPHHLEMRTSPYLRKPQNKLPPPRSSWPRSGIGCNGWETAEVPR